MPGPPPKRPEERRRRNKTAGPVTVRLEPEPARSVVPELPRDGELLPETRAYWQTLWASPMAAMWLDVDVPALVRLTMLVEQIGRGSASTRVLSEIRALEDRFGLSPLARRRLQWEMPGAGGVSPAGSGEGDDSRWLRVVSD